MAMLESDLSVALPAGASLAPTPVMATLATPVAAMAPVPETAAAPAPAAKEGGNGQAASQHAGQSAR